MQFAAVLTPAEKGVFVALNPQTGTTTQSATVADVVASLKEATALFLEELPHAARGHPLATMFSLPEPADA